METMAYGGWPNCVRLSNGRVDLVVTTDVGPRIIRFGFAGGQNLFKEYAEQLGKTGGDEWRIYGGHRLWHAPEAKPRTYAPDNGPVTHEWNGSTLRITQPVEASTGIQKQMEISLDADADHVTVLHRLINRNQWEVELAPWSLTVMTQKGRAIFPQEPYIPHTEKLLPARPLVLWNYTDMADPRWTWGAKYVQLQQDPKATAPQKIGILNTLGWAAYTLDGDVFVKRFPCVAGGEYPDYGVNNETFTNDEMLEMESVGPLAPLAADGGMAEHTESWYLFKADLSTDEAALEKQLTPLLAKTAAPK
ncbi:MAG: hypothetical protein JXR94_17195 [Candidatus Hydrogenedentes bacterium]|nr:hypothetical protein [Candidatus Hydrogenedentota bacterium]